MKTFLELKKEIQSRLIAACGEFSEYETLKIINHLTGLDKSKLILKYNDKIENVNFDYLDKIIEKRISGIPLEYILGETTFYNQKLFINSNCLIPQTDTEFVCEKALDFIKRNNYSNIVDLCTGSGAIAITIAQNSSANVTAIDISEKALDVARFNVYSLDLGKRIELICADCLNDPLLSETYDLIISNPPYIKSSDIESLPIEVKNEPLIALDGGNDGMDFYKAILSYAPKHLTKNGMIIFEIGYDEEEKINILASSLNLNCTVLKDYSSNPRVAIIERK